MYILMSKYAVLSHVFIKSFEGSGVFELSLLHVLCNLLYLI